MNPEQIQAAKERAAKMVERAGMALTEQEREQMELVELGLGEFERTGLAIVVYVNNDRYCAKEMVLFSRQSCPEHRHPAVGDKPGKMETFRCRWGRVWLYVEGEPVDKPACRPPVGSEDYYTVFHEIALEPGQQYTVGPDTLHWFQAGDEGAVVSEFSSSSTDENDIFTDPRIQRVQE